MTDEALFARYKEGDQAAFDTLLQKYQAPLFSMILKSVRNRAEAEDIFQEVFFKIVEKRDLFRADISFKAWMYTIARNTCIDAARKHKRTPIIDSMFTFDDNDKPLEINLKDKGLSPQDSASFAETDKFLDEILSALPPEQKETFYLRVKGELTFEEIGEVMQCSVNTTKSRMRYALEHLREIFRKRGYLK